MNLVKLYGAAVALALRLVMQKFDCHKTHPKACDFFRRDAKFFWLKAENTSPALSHMSSFVHILAGERQGCSKLYSLGPGGLGQTGTQVNQLPCATSY